MKKMLILLILLIGLVACTPSADEDNTLPTRVILPTDDVTVVENPTDFVVDPLEVATDFVVDPLEVATDFVVDPLEVATDFVVDPLEVATDFVVDPLEVATDFVVDPLEVATDFVVDPLTTNPTAPPIIIPASQTQPPSATPPNGLTVVMPTIDLTNLPTSVPTATPYPLVENFATLTAGTQIVRLRGTVEFFIEVAREDDIFILRDADDVPVELFWDPATIDNIPANGQIIEAIGTLRQSPYAYSTLLMDVISIIPISAVEEESE